MVTNPVEIEMRGGGSRRKQRYKPTEGPQVPGKFEGFVLGKHSKGASIMYHFNQKSTTHSMESCTHLSNMIKYE